MCATVPRTDPPSTWAPSLFIIIEDQSRAPTTNFEFLNEFSPIHRKHLSQIFAINRQALTIETCVRAMWRQTRERVSNCLPDQFIIADRLAKFIVLI